MKKMKKRCLLILLSLFTVPQVISAQEPTIDYLLTLQLPSLDVLFEGARTSNMVKFYESRIEGEGHNLKTEKRRWMEYFTLSATYQYGVMGVVSYVTLGSNNSIAYQTSGGNQNWYNFGGAIMIPLSGIYDRRNKIRRQEVRVRETIRERDMQYDSQRMKIIELYNKAQSILIYLRLVIEQYTLANAQFDVAQKEYIVGSTTAMSLSTAKSLQVQTFVQMESLKADLIAALMQLEILSNTKIINK